MERKLQMTAYLLLSNSPLQNLASSALLFKSAALLVLSLPRAASTSAVLDGSDGMMASYRDGLGVLRYSSLLLAAVKSPLDRNTSAVLDGKDPAEERRGFCARASCLYVAGLRCLTDGVLSRMLRTSSRRSDTSPSICHSNRPCVTGCA